MSEAHPTSSARPSKPAKRRQLADVASDDVSALRTSWPRSGGPIRPGNQLRYVRSLLKP